MQPLWDAVFLAPFLLQLVLGLTPEPCEFPQEWRGHWFQSGLGKTISITNDTFSGMGLCVDSHRNYYLVEDTIDEYRCHRCLLMMGRHDNVIQYKESFCVGPDSLRSICNMIRVEAVSNTLVREPSTPQPCPFQGAYFFTYNNNSGGFCRSPMSSLEQCTGESDFRFRFRHCEDAEYTHDKEVSFQCLATSTWKDGHNMYMYGDFADFGLTKTDYRCFVYRLLGTVHAVVYLAMSADATCRGLRSHTDGPLVMELTKDIYGWPQLGCDMPEWLNRAQWMDMSTKHTYIPQHQGQVLEVHYRRDPEEQARIPQTFRCIRLENSTNNEVVMLSFTLNKCDSSYQCTRIRQRQPDVIELDEGQYVRDESDRCPPSTFLAASRHTLMRCKPATSPESGLPQQESSSCSFSSHSSTLVVTPHSALLVSVLVVAFLARD